MGSTKTLINLDDHQPIQIQKNVSRRVWSYQKKFVSPNFGENEPCRVISCLDINTFWLRAVKDEEAFKNMQFQLQDYCKNAPTITRALKVEDFVFTKFREEFHRGIVLTTQDDTANIFFTDIGETDTISTALLLEPDHKIMQENHLYGLKYLLELKTQVTIGNEIVQPLAKPCVYLDFNKGPSEWENDQQSFTGGMYLCSGEAGKREKIQMSNLVKKIFTRRESEMRPFNGNVVTKMVTDMHVSPNLDHESNVCMTFYGFCNKLGVTAENDKVSIQKLANEIKTYMKRGPQISTAPRIGEVVLAPVDDGEYCRSFVENFTNDVASVKFLDRPGTKEIARNKLLNLTAEIAKHPVYGVTFHMYGIESIDEIDFTEDMKIGLDVTGQLELIKKEFNDFTGKLWIANDLMWNCLVKQCANNDEYIPHHCYADCLEEDAYLV